MKITLILIIAFILTGCGSQNGKLKIFVLKDSTDDKYFISDSVNIIFRSGQISNAPLIAIDGVVLNYQENLDTITLPLKKRDIFTVDFLNKKSSPVIYGETAVHGAVIINTVGLKYATDTLYLDKD